MGVIRMPSGTDEKDRDDKLDPDEREFFKRFLGDAGFRAFALSLAAVFEACPGTADYEADARYN